MRRPAFAALVLPPATREMYAARPGPATFTAVADLVAQQLLVTACLERMTALPPRQALALAGLLLEPQDPPTRWAWLRAAVGA